MIKILIHGIKDGEHDIDLSVPCQEVDGMFPEFFGDIIIRGKLRKLGNRFSVTGEASCNSRLVCDLSLKEYTQEIVVDISASYYANDDLFFLKTDHGEKTDNEVVIREDEKYLDLTEEVSQQLAVGLPMKRIAPDMLDVDFNEIYPALAEGKAEELSNSGDIPDERWAPLKKIKLN